MSESVERRSEKLARALRSSLRPDADPVTVLDRAARAVLGVVPAEVWCAVTLDPATMLDTGGQLDSGFGAHVMPRLFEIEHVEQDDVDNIRALARRKTPVSVLSSSTRGQLDTSSYFRDILRPEGLADELRVLLRHGGHVWGLLVFCRDNRPFTPDDVAVTAHAVQPTTEALRRALLLSHTDTGEVPDAPGVVVLNQKLDPVSTSQNAQLFLEQIPERHEAPGRPHPNALEAVAAAVTRGEAASARIRTRVGRWISLHASLMEHGGETMIAVSVAPTQPGPLAALVLDAYGLSARQRAVAQQILLGRSTTEVAAALHVSTNTVQDHLKAVFDKVGVRARPDLVGQLFSRHYLPYLANPPLATDGRMRDPDGSGVSGSAS